jgi:hypothetical protein
MMVPRVLATSEGYVRDKLEPMSVALHPLLP